MKKSKLTFKENLNPELYKYFPRKRFFTTSENHKKTNFL